MTKHQKIKPILLFLTLFSLSLLVIAPMIGAPIAQPNNPSLITSTISATQTPENINVGQTWKYRITYRNATFTHSGTFTEKITGIKNITDWNGSTQECYVFQTRVDLDELVKIFLGKSPSGVPIVIPSGVPILTVDRYINTTNFSNPRTDTQFKYKTPIGDSIEFTSYLRNATFNIYKFPLSIGSWQTTVNQNVSGWTLYGGTNSTYGPYYQPTSVNASVAGPVNVTVPAGTFETWQINYTNDVMCDLFYYLLYYYVEDIDQVQGWYSLEAGNFVKYFMEVDTIFPWGGVTDENVTIEMITPFPSSILLFALSFSTQQQASTNLLLIGGLIAVVAVIATVGIVIVLVRRRG